MARLTTDWTDQHVAVAGAAVTASITGAVAGLGEDPYVLWGIVALTLTILGALSTDTFGGLVSGFVGAAVVVAARQVAGDWTREIFGLALALSVCLVVVGWMTGFASTRLRAVRGAPASGASDTEPAFGSLGLLPPPLALVRLDEEVSRAQRHGRPLTVVLLRTEVTDPALSAAARSGLYRTVARLVESLVPETAVPFALAPDQVGAILPETDVTAAWELLGPVVDTADHASFAVRDQEERRSVSDCAELLAGMVPLSEEHPDADSIVAGLQDAVRPASSADLGVAARAVRPR